MILIILVIGALAFFLAFMFVNQSVVRSVALLVSGVIFVGATGLMVANYHNHYGMHQVTVETTQRVYSASPASPVNMVLYKPIGTNGTETVYLYGHTTTAKTPSHTTADEYTINRVHWTSGTTATRTTKTTRWEYRNDFDAWLFKWSGMEHTLIKRVNTFNLPRTWVKLSVKQAAKLQQQLKQPTVQAKMATQGKQYVAARVRAAMVKDPQLSTSAQQRLMKQAQAEFEAQAIRKLVQ